MRRLSITILFLCIIFHISVKACTIVAVSGRVTADGRPLLLKNRDSKGWDIRIRIINGPKYTYLCQCNVGNMTAFSGFNEAGFSIVSSHSYNMTNHDYNWNAYIMQLALGKCASVEDFEHLLDTLSKPVSVCANYGVLDAQGNVAIFETNAFTHVRYDADSSDSGFLIRTNFSFSESTDEVNAISPSSFSRYQIASDYVVHALKTEGAVSKDILLGLPRCLVDSGGVNLIDMAPFGESDITPVDFTKYVPRYISTSAMVIQGVLPGESPRLTVAWTMVGPPLTTVAIPYLITSHKVLPQKAKPGTEGHTWLVSKGQQMKNKCFIDSRTVDLAKLYNRCHTGVMQKVVMVEDEILCYGNRLLEGLRNEIMSDKDIEDYYTWIDNYLDDQYKQVFEEVGETNAIKEIGVGESPHTIYYYDIIGRQTKNPNADGVVIRKGTRAIILR